MKKPVKRLRRGYRLGALEKRVLVDLSAGDLLVGFLYSAHSTRKMYAVARQRALHRYRIKNVVQRLSDEGLIVRRGDMVSISKSGRSLLNQTVDRVRSSIRTKKWDGKWRIITFDIPEKMRSVRNDIRTILKRAGFIQLQHSTWIFPHDCEELSTLIKQDTRLTRYVLYGVLEKIENDAHLRQLFSLR